jgi:signal peptidase II
MRAVWLPVSIIAIDQITKTIVRSRMRTGESIPLIGDWLKFTYTENPGMAFGIEFGSPLVVTTLAIVATIMIVLYLRMVGTDSLGFSLGLGLILGGAIGNIIDRTFYGVIYGYSGFFRGQVVDFIHVDLWSGRIAEWVPLLGGRYLALFPIWNVADMAIVVGVVLVIIFQQMMHSETTDAATGTGSETSDEGASETPATEPVHP